MAGRNPDMSNTSRIHSFHPERYGDVFHRAGEYLADDGEIDAQEAPVLLKASGRTAGGGGSHAVGGAQAHSRRITPLRSKKRPGDGPAEASSS